MKTLYNEINIIMNNICFNELWPGFKKYPFALYNKSNVYFENEIIPYDTRFIGNTSIKYNDNFIAIWYVENPRKEDSKVLASNIIHEMFHAFQCSNGEKRFPNDLFTLHYPSNLQNYQLKYYENTLISNCLKEQRLDKKEELLQKFFSVRNKRESLIGTAITCEYLTETIEGLAEYIGTKALKRISPTLYEQRIDSYIKKITNLRKSFFDIRKSSYYVGTLFFLALDSMNISFYEDLSTSSNSIYEELKEKLYNNSFDYPFDLNYEVETAFYEYDKWKRKRLADFCNNNLNENIGNFKIVGYDPMNMLKIGDYILCNHFIKLSLVNSDSTIFINEPVLLKLKTNSIKEIISYYTLK